MQKKTTGGMSNRKENGMVRQERGKQGEETGDEIKM